MFGYFLIAVTLYVGYWFVSTYFLWQHGQQLEQQIKSEALTDPDQIWTQWTELSGDRSSSVVLYGPRHLVKKRLVAAADNVLANYRTNDTPPVRDGDWKRAHAWLAKALTLDPGDDSVRGRLRLCEGHTARIDGTAHRNQALLNEAEAKFNEAQHLMHKSPDPQLGLARLYVYGFHDIEKADAALHEAERHGYQLLSRDRAQLADGYRQRADRLWSDSRKVRGLPQEKEQLQKVADDYRRALQLYQEIAPYNNTGVLIARVQASLESVTIRLLQLQEGGSGWR
jgi:hypothetical protein